MFHRSHDHDDDDDVDAYLCSSVGVLVYVTIESVFERRFSSDFLAV